MSKEEKIVCIKCREDKSKEAERGQGDMYRPENWKHTMPWLMKEFYLCGKCLQIIILDWIYDHVNKNGEIM